MKIKTKSKLVLLLISFFTLVVIAFSITIYFLMRQELYNSVDNKLLSIAEISSDSPFLLYNQNIPKKLKDFYNNPNLQHSGSILRILDTSGNIGSDLNDINVKDLPVKRETIKKALNGIMVFENYNLENLKFPVRVLTYPVVSNGYVLGIIQVGTSLEFVTESLKKLIIILSMSFPILVLITLFFGYYIIDRAFAPIRMITAKAKKISAENLEEKIGGNLPDDEIGELAATFDEMITRLKSSFEALHQFSADVSHELRTPLTVLQGEVEVALRGNREPEEYKKVLKSSLEEVQRLKKIVETLLFLSKAESGQLIYKIKEIDVLDLIVSVISTLQPFIKEKNINVKLNAEPDIVFKGDDSMLKQLFYNIIHNAIKYNRVNGHININVDEKNGFVNVEIEDTGFGMNDRQVENIFNRFYRIDKARTRKEGGYGLGLNIAKKIVDLHNGKIIVESEINKGTKFIVSLPKNF